MTTENIPNYIQKGYFIDLVYTFERQYQWEVVSIFDNKAMLRNLKDDSSKLTIDISGNKIKPFRTITKPSENPGYFQRTYCYWGDGIKTCLELIKKYNNAPTLKDSGSSVCEIIQFFRGYNYFLIYSLTEERKITPENKNFVHEYIREYLKLFLKYWKEIIMKTNFSEYDPKKIYENIDNALVSAHTEMLICLNMLFTRQSNLEIGAGGLYKFDDQLISEQVTWLTRELLPIIVEPDVLMNLSFEICTKLLLIILKLLISSRLSREQIVNQSIVCLTGAAENSLKSIQFSRHNQYYFIIHTLFENCTKTDIEFIECVKLKIKYLMRVQNLMNDYVISDNERTNIISKGLAFMFYIISEYPELKELILQFLNHENGITYFIKHSNMTNHSKELLRIFKLFPNEYFHHVNSYRKLDLLKLPTGNWTPQLMNGFIKVSLSSDKNSTKQDLSFCINVHKTFLAQISSIQTIAKSITSVQNGGPPIVNNQSIASIDPGFIQKFIKQIPSVYESLAFLQTKIVRQCEKMYDASEKTMVIQYVERYILEKHLNREFNNIEAQLDMKQTNNFRENIIFKAYISKVLSNIASKSASQIQEVIIMFNKLCTSMVFFKQKSALESRKDNLITIMQKCANLIPRQTVDMLCTYIESVANVQNREFKNKSTDFFTTTIAKTNLLRNSEQGIQMYKKIMNKFKLENLCQLRTFMDMFKFVNTRENSLKLTEDSHLPIVIYRRPFGLQKLLEAFESSVGDKGFSRKLCAFFYKFDLKILSDDQTRRQLLEEVTQRLINILAVSGVKHNKTKLQQQFIQEISSLIQSFLATKQDIAKSDYEKMFQKISKLGSGHSAMNPTVIQQESITSNKTGRKYKIIVKYDDIINKQQNDIEANKLFLTQCQWDEPLYSIKWKSCDFFNVSPLITNLWQGFHKIEYQGELGTIQQYYNTQMYHKSNKREEYNMQEIKQGAERSQGKPESDSPKQQQITVIMDLKYNIANDETKSALFKKRDVVFCCLPYTIKIWNQLGIKYWQDDPVLTEIKELFINSYPTTKSDKQTQSMQQNVQNDWWTTIVEDPYKKKFLFEALLEDQKLQNSKISWIADTFTQATSLIKLENNILSMCLIQKLKPKLNENEVTKIMYNIQIDEKELNEDHSKETVALQESYEKLIKMACKYIINNDQFCLFTFLMSFKHSFYENLMANQKYLEEIRDMFLFSFAYYVQKNYHNHLNDRMLKFLQHFNLNYSFFLRILERADDTYLTDLDFMKNFFNNWLDFTVKIIIDNKSFILDMQNNSSIVRNLFETVCCLLLKKTKCCQQIFSEGFKNILSNLLYSKLCNQIIYIITYISTIYLKQGERYIKHFQKQMQDPEIDKKDYIKINRNNLRHESGYVGLRNPHSICYANSLLQQIYHIKPFRNEIYATKWKKNDSVEQDLIFQLKKIFVNLNFKQCQSYFNSQFFDAFKNDEGSATSIQVQMDVDQFRSILFDRIQNLVQRPDKQARNLVQKYFNGKEVTVVQGKQCGHQSRREDQFSTINLDVKGLKNFETALEQYFKPQILNQDNMYFCEDCNKKIIAEKRHVIKEYPKYLTFVLKRFEYIYQYRKKINERFEFPLRDFRFNDDAVYYLKGVIVHQGLSQAGHYFSLIRLMGKWFEFNDNQITEITEQDVIDEGYGQYTTRSNRNAYLLFYEKVENSSQDHKISEQQTGLQQFMRIQEGLMQEIHQIEKYNNMMWKSDLFLSLDFERFIQSSVKSKLKGSLSLLFQYITTIKSKCHKPDLNNLKELFQLLEDNCSGSLLQSNFFVDCAIKFYKNTHFHTSLKAVLTQIIARKYSGFDQFTRRFLSMCLTSIHQEVETGAFFKIFLVLAKKDPEVLKFLVDNRIIGRIYDICFQQVLLSLDRQEIAKQSQINFPIIDESKFERKRKVENSELRYHKWKLMNFILESKLQLNKIQQTYIQNWAARKSQQIYEEATTKANINQISKFFCIICKRNAGFSTLYLTEVCEQISKDRSEHLRKYLKAASDLLKIQDNLKQQRIKKIKFTFAETFKSLHKQKIMSSFDVKWQWFMKIAIQNEDFRKCIQQNEADFRILHSRSELQSLYLTRNQINSEGKNKNKYFGLKFSLLSSVNNNFLDEKIEKNKQIFQSASLKDSSICSVEIQNHLDTDLVTIESEELKEGSEILKYLDNSLTFQKVIIKNILGDMIEINQTYFDRGDERLLGIPKQNIKQENIEPQLQKKIELLQQIKQVKQEYDDNPPSNTLTN